MSDAPLTRYTPHRPPLSERLWFLTPLLVPALLARLLALRLMGRAGRRWRGRVLGVEATDALTTREACLSEVRALAQRRPPSLDAPGREWRSWLLVMVVLWIILPAAWLLIAALLRAISLVPPAVVTICDVLVAAVLALSSLLSASMIATEQLQIVHAQRVHALKVERVRDQYRMIGGELTLADEEALRGALSDDVAQPGALSEVDP
jgi:hypothetical protein